jgi:hypothetical protein
MIDDGTTVRIPGNLQVTGSVVLSSALTGSSATFNGNMGIGLTSPNARLTLNDRTGNTTNTGDLLINQSANTINSIGGIELKSDGAGSGYAWKIQNVFDGNSAYDYTIQSRTNTTTWTERFRLASTGAATFSSNVTATGTITMNKTGGYGILAQDNGNNSAANGAYIGWTNSANTRYYIGQLDTNNDLNYHYFNGTIWSTSIIKFSNAGAATFASSVQSSSLIVAGSGYFPAKLITLGGAEFSRYNANIGTNIVNGSQIGLSFGTRSNNVDYDNTLNLLNGNVGIGTISPSYQLSLNSATPQLGLSSTSATGYAEVYFSRNTSTTIAYLAAGVNSTVSANGDEFVMQNMINGGNLVFRTNNGSTTERMRITSGGQLLVGSTSAGVGFVNALKIGSYQGYTTDSNSTAISAQRTAGFFGVDAGNNSNNQGSYCSIVAEAGWGASVNPGAIFRGYGNSTLAVQINYNGNITNTNNSYGSLSDISLKENIVNTSSKLNDLLKVRIVNYNLIGQEEKHLGVIAQELEEIFPAMIETNSESLKSVKYSVFVPMLIKAIQELKAEIDILKAQ